MLKPNCQVCNGTGRYIASKCTNCKGSGYSKTQIRVHVLRKEMIEKKAWKHISDRWIKKCYS